MQVDTPMLIAAVAVPAAVFVVIFLVLLILGFTIFRA